MRKNEGTLDRIIRAILGLAMGAAGYFYLSGAWAIVAYVLAAILLFTALTGFCALYLLLKIDTLKKGHQ
jgi:hypothetical protein